MKYRRTSIKSSISGPLTVWVGLFFIFSFCLSQKIPYWRVGIFLSDKWWRMIVFSNTRRHLTVFYCWIFNWTLTRMLKDHFMCRLVLTKSSYLVVFWAKVATYCQPILTNIHIAGLVLFSKRFTMLDTELVYSQCDMSWLYHSLVKATDAIIKCESGLHFWKLFSTPAWNSLVKYCDSLDKCV